MSELVVVMKSGRKQRSVIGAVLAAKDAPPFAGERDGYRLRWWGSDHPVSQKLRSLVEVRLPNDGNGHGREMPSGEMFPITVGLADCCERFKTKHGYKPRTVWVNPCASVVSDDGVEIVTDKRINIRVVLVGPLP